MNILVDRPVAKPRQMTKEELTQLIDQKYQRRTFIADDIKEYVASLPPEKAFALSRLLPKEVLAKLLGARGAEAFGNNVIEFYLLISKEGKLDEAMAKTAEELFLVTHTTEIIKLIGGSGY